MPIFCYYVLMEADNKNPQFSYPGESQFGYTLNAKEVAQLRQQAERSIGSTERATIGSDTQIQEGVYEGAYGGEAIVVDYDADPGLIDDAINAVKERATVDGKIDKGRVLHNVFDVVRERMLPNQRAVDEIFKSVGEKDGTKISLSIYIDKAVGVCRHQALFVGIILERLIDDETLRGSVSVDRSQRSSATEDKYDGHSWARYTTSSNEVIIIDTALNTIDTLENLRNMNQKNPFDTWDYSRTEDKMASVVGASKIIDHPIDMTPYMNPEGIIDRVPGFPQ